MRSEQAANAPASAAQYIGQLKRNYDAQVKNFLKEKEILSVILKHCAAEPKGCDVKDIAGKYIEGTPQAAKVFGDRDVISVSAGTKISGTVTENKSITEGLVASDIRFTALAPATREPIKPTVNAKAQKRSSKQSYPIIKRPIYYCAGMLSARKNVEFTGMDYGKIRKVYSIRICQDMPENRKGSILTYDIAEHVIEKRPGLRRKRKGNCDLMTAVIAGLGYLPQAGASDVLRMLSTAL